MLFCRCTDPDCRKKEKGETVAWKDRSTRCSPVTETGNKKMRFSTYQVFHFPGGEATLSLVNDPEVG